MTKLLVALDNSKYAQKVTEEACKLAASLDAEVTLLTVMEDLSRISGMGSYPNEIFENMDETRKKELEQFLQQKAELFKQQGVKVDTKLVKGNQPGQTVCDTAKDGGYSFIILGSRGLGGLTRLFLGSVSNWVVQCAEQNVILVKM